MPFELGSGPQRAFSKSAPTMMLLAFSFFLLVTSTLGRGLSLEEETCQSPAESRKPKRVHKRALFTDAAIEELAEVVKDKIFIPLVPTPIITFCLNAALDKMNTGLSPELSFRVEEMLLAETTDTLTDDFSDEELTELAKMTASEVNPTIPVLILREETREKVLQQVFKIVFSVIANSSKERRLALFSSAKDIALDLFQPASRHKLVERINEIIDVPVLNESQEEKLLSVGIDYCASTLENLLPKQLVTSLRSENSASMDEFKKFLVAEVNKRVNIYGFSEEQERKVIRAIVDLWLDEVDTGARDLLYLPEEQKIRYMDQASELTKEIAQLEKRYKQELTGLKEQLSSVELKLDELGPAEVTA